MVVLLAACGGKRGAEGAGPSVNFCEGYTIYSIFDEPKPDDAGELDMYTSAMIRVIDRIKPNFRVQLPKGPPLRIPPEVGDDLETLKSKMIQLRADVRSAKGDKAQIRQAVNRFAEDATLNAADQRLVDFAESKCPSYD